MTTTTDTPRTRMETAHLLCDSDNFEDVISTLKKEGEELERELAKAEAERDEARKDLIKNLQTTGGMPWREWSAECAKETLRADENLERAEKAEAEVERLDEERRELSRELHLWEMGNYYKPKMQSKIDELKAEAERLREQLQQAVDIAEELNPYPNLRNPLVDELDAIKATLNHDNK